MTAHPVKVGEGTPEDPYRILWEEEPVTRGLTPEQYTYLLNPLRSTRVATRRQGGKNLSYLEAWDVKAHLTRIFGFGNWDSEVVDYGHVATREYMSEPDEKKGIPAKPMVEVIYRARVQLTIRDQWGMELCRHSEVAVGSTSGPANMLGEHHDNAVKTAASDALKRCAINLGTQFGLSLYDNGSKADVIRQTLVKPVGVVEQEPTPEQQAAIAQVEERIGAVQPEDKTLEEVSERVQERLAAVQKRLAAELDMSTQGPINGTGMSEQTAPKTKAETVAFLRKRLGDLPNDQADDLKAWWSNESRLPPLSRINAEQAGIVLARIDLIEKQALLKDRLGAEEVRSANEVKADTQAGPTPDGGSISE